MSCMSNSGAFINFVYAYQDVTMKVISFSQQGPRAICILSANGVISSVTLRQPNSSGGTLTYEVLNIVISFINNTYDIIYNENWCCILKFYGFNHFRAGLRYFRWLAHLCHLRVEE